MTVTLVVPEDVSTRLRELANEDLESGGVILARLIRAGEGDIRLLVRELLEVPHQAYEHRETRGLQISSDGYVPALGTAAEMGCVPIWFHTHTGRDGTPTASRHDDKVDEQLSDLFRLRADSEFYGSLIISVDDRFTGQLDDGERSIRIDRMVSVGPRLKVVTNFEDELEPLPELLDRNIRAFGGDVQRVLSGLRIGVVGCGGTGSAVAEQLVRLGVRDLILIDPDELSASNVTRVHESGYADVGGLKVEVLAKHLARITRDTHITPVAGKITVESVARQLNGTDVVFGCTDDNAGRLTLSRLSTFLLIPVIDCGVLLTADSSGRLDGIHGRVTVMHPGAACLICRGRIDLARASSEALEADEREARVREGYAPALGAIEPAVVTFTTMVGAMAVSELLERLTGFGVDPAPSEVLMRLHDRELSTNHQEPRRKHFCDRASGKWGAGDTSPFLEQVWPS